MISLSQNQQKIKKLARRMRGLAARREALTDSDIEQFVLAAVLDRVWATFGELTSPRASVPAD